MDNNAILGIDIGGSAVKSALVDTSQGAIVGDKLRIVMPELAKPEDVKDIIIQTIEHFEYSGLVGCGFPAKISSGIVQNAANIDPTWIGVNINNYFNYRHDIDMHVINDADAAGLAEMNFTKSSKTGLVIFLTLGTGIGSALFVDGKLIPNTELGHLQYHFLEVEDYAAASIRKIQKLTWNEWTARLNEVLRYMEFLFSPDLFILGGGISKDWKKFIPELSLATPVIPAKLRNQAGIIGAALYAEQNKKQAE